ncbi:MAG: NHL repeat-containing protein [Fidelibacterota bacterium]
MKATDFLIKRWLPSVGIAALAAILSSGCVEKMPLPARINVPVEFSAGDTSYLMMNPIWDETYGLVAPLEVSVAPDGHIFVADSGANAILVLKQDGTVLESFGGLRDLEDGEGEPLSPIDVDIDGKMNIFFVDGSRRVYRWNQVWNQVGVDSIASSATFVHGTTGVTVTLLAGSGDWVETANDDDWALEDVDWVKDASAVDSLLAPHLFFDAGSAENDARDLYYAGTLSRFSGISSSLGEDYVYLTDAYHNRIIRVDFERSQLVKLSIGQEVWIHRGIFGHTVSGFGTGAGTVNKPVAVDVDFAGNLYYAQRGDYFSIHKVSPTTAGGYTSYSSVFQQGENDIMDLWRFSLPSDVAADEKQSIYVANTGAQEIQVFNSDGSFFNKAGVTGITVDTTLEIVDGQDTVLVDTFLTVEKKGILESPRAVAVDSRGIVYVCDTPRSRIVRYRLSNALDENITPDN